MELPGVFKKDELEDAGFGVMPAGVYLAEITKAEMKETNAKDGKYLALTFTIIDGEFTKRNVFTNLNLVNKNADTVRIAESDMKAIMEAGGLDEAGETEDFLGLTMAIKVTVKAATNTWPERNEIKGYKPESDYEGSDEPFGEE